MGFPSCYTHTDPPISCSLGKAEHVSAWIRVDLGTRELPQQHIWRWLSWLNVPSFFASLCFKLLRKRDGFSPRVPDTRAVSVPRSGSSQYLWVKERRRPAQARRCLNNRRDESVIQEASLGSCSAGIKKSCLENRLGGLQQAMEKHIFHRPSACSCWGRRWRREVVPGALLGRSSGQSSLCAPQPSRDGGDGRPRSSRCRPQLQGREGQGARGQSWIVLGMNRPIILHLEQMPGAWWRASPSCFNKSALAGAPVSPDRLRCLLPGSQPLSSKPPLSPQACWARSCDFRVQAGTPALAQPQQRVQPHTCLDFLGC